MQSYTPTLIAQAHQDPHPPTLPPRPPPPRASSGPQATLSCITPRHALMQHCRQTTDRRGCGHNSPTLALLKMLIIAAAKQVSTLSGCDADQTPVAPAAGAGVLFLLTSLVHTSGRQAWADGTTKHLSQPTSECCASAVSAAFIVS